MQNQNRFWSKQIKKGLADDCFQCSDNSPTPSSQTYFSSTNIWSLVRGALFHSYSLVLAEIYVSRIPTLSFISAYLTKRNSGTLYASGLLHVP